MTTQTLDRASERHELADPAEAVLKRRLEHTADFLRRIKQRLDQGFDLDAETAGAIRDEYQALIDSVAAVELTADLAQHPLLPGMDLAYASGFEPGMESQMVADLDHEDQRPQFERLQARAAAEQPVQPCAHDGCRFRPAVAIHEGDKVTLACGEHYTDYLTDFVTWVEKL